MYEDKARLLTAALRSGEYPQTRMALCLVKAAGDAPDDAPVGFCCLGVACEVAMANGVEMTTEIKGATKFYNGGSAYMPQAVVDFFGFKNSHGASYTENGPVLMTTSKGLKGSLAQANDTGVPFDEIADLIDANYEIL